jgi:hypothetical protein
MDGEHFVVNACFGHFMELFDFQMRPLVLAYLHLAWGALDAHWQFHPFQVIVGSSCTTVIVIASCRIMAINSITSGQLKFH